MAYPPSSLTSRSDSDAAIPNSHSADHTAERTAINDIVTELGSSLKGSYASLIARLVALAPITPDTVPASPSAYDYEFTATSSSAPASWTLNNFSGCTYNEAQGLGAFLIPTGGGDNQRSLIRAIPTESSWRAVAKMSNTGGYNYKAHGLILRRSGGPSAVTLTWNGGTEETRYDIWSNDSTFSSEIISRIGPRQAELYFQIKKNSSSSWDFGVGVDGVNFFSLLSARAVATDIGGAPDQIGIAALNNDSGVAQNMIASCEWFRVFDIVP